VSSEISDVLLFVSYLLVREKAQSLAIIFGCVLYKLIFFVLMSDSHNKLQCRNNYNHWNILDLVFDLNYFSFSNPNINPNPTHLTKPWALIISFLRVFYMSNITVHVHMAWSQKFRKSDISLDTGMQRQDKAYAATIKLSAVRMSILLPM